MNFVKIIVISFLFLNISCATVDNRNSSQPINLVGKWQGLSKGDLGAFVFMPDGKVDVIKNGKSLRDDLQNGEDSLYVVDTSKNPMHLDIIILNSSGKERGRLKAIFEYISSKSIRVRLSFDGIRPDNFLNSTEEDTIVLDKVE